VDGVMIGRAPTSWLDGFPATALPIDPSGTIFAPRRICVLAPSRRIETVPVGIEKCR